MVAIMTIVDTASVILMAHACWYYFATTGPFHRYVWSVDVKSITFFSLNSMVRSLNAELASSLRHFILAILG
ncbi:hypothetical protein DFS33DRAFT_1336042 [Desarmillaria ectypa]|nr:hypothetical protein DFS33DRAFT_1336042 [Desarmillaria ectypa]